MCIFVCCVQCWIVFCLNYHFEHSFACWTVVWSVVGSQVWFIATTWIVFNVELVVWSSSSSSYAIRQLGGATQYSFYLTFVLLLLFHIHQRAGSYISFHFCCCFFFLLYSVLTCSYGPSSVLGRAYWLQHIVKFAGCWAPIHSHQPEFG